MSSWELQTSGAIAQLSSPEELDRRILHNARQFKPPKKDRRWMSRTLGSCTALAALLMLVHPAQYLSAKSGFAGAAERDTELSGAQIHWQQDLREALRKADPWHTVRAEADARDYVSLCTHWRQQQAGEGDSLPRDLAGKARSHCRTLSP